jgi:hypothetical protein
MHPVAKKQKSSCYEVRRLWEKDQDTGRFVQKRLKFFDWNDKTCKFEENLLLPRNSDFRVATGLALRVPKFS